MTTTTLPARTAAYLARRRSIDGPLARGLRCLRRASAYLENMSVGTQGVTVEFIEAWFKRQ
jgi:hypothetical protein